MAKTTFTVTNTTDGVPVVISTESGLVHLHDYFVDLQLIAGAGTVNVEVLGAGNVWRTHTASADPTANDIVHLSQDSADMYRDCRVTFTGTTATNTVGVTLRKRL